MDDKELAYICAAYGLGQLGGSARPVHGGLLHCIWFLRATAGSFAVKVLNPEVLSRPGARQNFVRTEHIAALVAAAGIPTAVALDGPEGPLFELRAGTVMVFPWVVGRTYFPAPPDPERGRRIGGLLARIHGLNLQVPDLPSAPRRAIPASEWAESAYRAARVGAAWSDALRHAAPHLARRAAEAERSIASLGPEQVVSHRDLDPGMSSGPTRRPRCSSTGGAAEVLSS